MQSTEVVKTTPKARIHMYGTADLIMTWRCDGSRKWLTQEPLMCAFS